MGTCRIEQDQNPSKKPRQNLYRIRGGNTYKEKKVKCNTCSRNIDFSQGAAKISEVKIGG